MLDALSILLRATSFVALFQAAGMAMFLALFHEHLAVDVAATVRRGALAATLAALALTTAHFAVEPARMGGELAGMVDPSLWSLLLDLSLAKAFGWRMAGLLILLFGLWRGSTTGRALALLGTTLVLFAFTQVGHTQTSSPRSWLALLLFAHVATVAFWFGALLPLRTVAVRERPGSAARIVERFSRLAVGWVAVLFAAGAGMAALLLGTWSRVSSPYGLLLVAKLVLFTALMALAALNRWRFGPAIARGGPAARQALSRTIEIEFVLICVVLAATATLTTLFSPES